MVALVMLPGMDGTGDLFSEFLASLGPGVEPVVMVYPPDRPLEYSELESIARSCLPSRRPFVLLGESFSGPIAISIAASAPPGLRGLILCGAFARNPRPGFGVLTSLLGLVPARHVPMVVLGRMLLGRFSSERRRSALAQALARVSPAALRARLLAVRRVDVVPKLAQVRVPVLSLRRSEDRVVPRAASELIAQVLPAARVVELEAPHFLLQAAPGAAADAVMHFVREVTFAQ